MSSICCSLLRFNTLGKAAFLMRMIPILGPPLAMWFLRQAVIFSGIIAGVVLVIGFLMLEHSQARGWRGATILVDHEQKGRQGIFVIGLLFSRTEPSFSRETGFGFNRT